MTPFYRALPNLGGFGVELTAEEIGIGVVAVHAVGTVVKKQNAKKRESELASTREEAAQGANLVAAGEATRKWPNEATEE